MRKIVSLLIFSIIISLCSISFADGPVLQGESGIIIDYETGDVLYEKNMDMKLFPASTTKITTAILALELGNLSDIVTVDQNSVNLTEGSHIALEPGEKLTLEQLLYALMVQSANDAANVIATHISGSIDEFVKLMNQKAAELGAVNTHYVNPNGLHDEDHVSTAADLAIIARYAMKNETFRTLVNTVTYTIEPTNIKTEARYFKNTNKLLFSSDKIAIDGQNIPIKYEGASGVKTGTTGHALSCLVSFAERGGQKLIAVVLKSTGSGVYADTHNLLNYGFNNFNNLTIGFENEFIENIKVENGSQSLVAGILDSNVVYPMRSDDLSNVERKINLRSSLVAPINKGDILGTAEYYLNDKLIASANIVSTIDMEAVSSFNPILWILNKWYIFLIILLIILRLAALEKRKKKRLRRRRSSYSVPYEIK